MSFTTETIIKCILCGNKVPLIATKVCSTCKRSVCPTCIVRNDFVDRDICLECNHIMVHWQLTGE
jgi:hypothetical protein